MSTIKTVVAAAIFAGGTAASADTYTYGSWVPTTDYINSHALPEVFRRVAEETNGEVEWELIAGGQLVGGVETSRRYRTG